MIGTDLNLTLPELADTYSVAIGKIATALEAIEDSIADAATPAALDITSNLSIGGNHLTNVGGIVLAAGNAPVAAGSAYYSGGNFYLKDATGVIQLTAAGAINLSAIGAIGGDYGSGDESFNYDLASQEFRAMASVTEWADLVCDDLILMEDSGSEFIRLKTPAALTSSYSVEFPSAVPASISLVQMSSAGVLTASNALPALDADTHVVVSGTGDYKHGEKMIAAPFGFTAHTPTGSLSISYTSNTIRWTITAAGLTRHYFPKLRTGWRLKYVQVLGSSASAASMALNLQNAFTNPSFGSTTPTGNFVGGFARVDFDAPYTIQNGDMLHVEVSAGADDVVLTTVQVVYDIA